MVFDQRRPIGIWSGEVGNRHRNGGDGSRYHHAEGQRACSCAGPGVVRTAALAAVCVWQRISRALNHAGGGAYGTRVRHRVRQRGTLPSEGQKQYPDDQPPMHLITLHRRWVNVVLSPIECLNPGRPLSAIWRIEPVALMTADGPGAAVPSRIARDQSTMTQIDPKPSDDRPK
jgi:hypothetical protein